MTRVGYEWVQGVVLPVVQGEAHACPYLPDREAREVYVVGGGIGAPVYGELMDRRFRRSGPVFYRPSCAGCAECVPIRVPVADFVPSRSQRRVLRRNCDLEVLIAAPSGDDEHFELYTRYQTIWHDGAMAGDQSDFEAFLARSPIETIEMQYRAAGRLLGVGLVDVCPASLSSVYFYFEPDEHRRGLGVFSGLCEIALARRWGKPHWYIGYYIRECERMNYKSRFRPYELLAADGTWRSATRGAQPG